jgi:hypothetical protein
MMHAKFRCWSGIALLPIQSQGVLAGPAEPAEPAEAVTDRASSVERT